MKKYLFSLIFIFLFESNLKEPTKKKYFLIQTVIKQLPSFNKTIKVAEVNQEEVKKLNEPLRALAALYSGLAGSNCDGKTCDLTKALGLEMQGSIKQKN